MPGQLIPSDQQIRQIAAAGVTGAIYFSYMFEMPYGQGFLAGAVNDYLGAMVYQFVNSGMSGSSGSPSTTSSTCGCPNKSGLSTDFNKLESDITGMISGI